MAARSQNTMVEFLQKMLADLSMAKTLPDADLSFLLQLETAVLQKLRSPIDAMMGQMQPTGQAGSPSPMSGGAPAAMAQGMPAPGQMPEGMAAVNPGGTSAPMQRVPGIRSDPGAINMDEFIRSTGGARG